MNAARNPSRSPPSTHRTRLAHRRRLRGVRHAAGGQTCIGATTTTIAFGVALTTSVLRADVDNAQRFSVIVDG